jgi:hypothetical protein
MGFELHAYNYGVSRYPFVNITATCLPCCGEVIFDYVDMIVETNGYQVSYRDDQASIGLVDLARNRLPVNL